MVTVYLMARRKWIQHVTAKNLPDRWHWQFGHELRIPTAASTVLQHHHPDFLDVSIGALWISLDFCPKTLHQQGKPGKKQNHRSSCITHVSFPWLFCKFHCGISPFFPCFLVHLPALGAPAGAVGATVAAGSDACTIGSVNIPLDEAKINGCW